MTKTIRSMGAWMALLLLLMYALGYFLVSSPSSWGFGVFSADLLGFFNSMGKSSLVPKIRAGSSLEDAVMRAGVVRARPIALTGLAAMIGAAAHFHFIRGRRDSLDLDVVSALVQAVYPRYRCTISVLSPDGGCFALTIARHLPPLLAGGRAPDRQGDHVVPHGLLAGDADEPGAGVAEDRLRPRLVDRRGEEDEQDDGQLHRPGPAAARSAATAMEPTQSRDIGTTAFRTRDMEQIPRSGSAPPRRTRTQRNAAASRSGFCASAPSAGYAAWPRFRRRCRCVRVPGG